MESVFRFVLKHRWWVLAAFACLTAFAVLCIPHVKVNADFSDYLPKDSPSTIAADVMADEFTDDVSNIRVYAEGVDVAEARQAADALRATDGVIDVTWLGDEVDLDKPLEVLDADTVSSWKDDGGYLYEVTMSAPFTQGGIDALRSAAESAGAQSVAVDGSAASTASTVQSVNADMGKIMLIAVAAVLLVLMLSTSSFAHPFIALTAIGSAIILNMGSNIIQGEVSTVTQLVASVLQLAVSMDYSIVVLSNYVRARDEEPDEFEATVKAMARSFPVVASSAAVTFFGFLSLVFMRFLIGSDMGIALAKGIAISFVCIVLITPCLLYILRKPAERLSHRSVLSQARGFARACRAVAVPAVVVAALVAAPAYLMQDKTEFTYGSSSSVSPTSQVSQDGALINGKFGEEQTWALLVPKEQWGNEAALVDELKALPTTNSVVSYTETVGSALPIEIAESNDAVSQLVGENYSRILLSSSVPEESDRTFALVEQVRDLAAQQYGDSYQLVGASVSTYDIKQVATADSQTVRLASVSAIGIVLLLMFRSVSIPVLLLLAIEASIWINLAVPYVLGQSTDYIGYLVIDAVQLGAAVDYSIIFAHEYLALRERMPAKEAAFEAISRTTQPILTSAGILILSSLGIYFAASSPMIQGLGMLIARGAALAVVMIFAVLPSLFVWGDRLIAKTSIGLHFWQEEGVRTSAGGAEREAKRKQLGGRKSTGASGVRA